MEWVRFESKNGGKEMLLSAIATTTRQKDQREAAVWDVSELEAVADDGWGRAPRVVGLKACIMPT